MHEQIEILLSIKNKNEVPLPQLGKTRTRNYELISIGLPPRVQRAGILNCVKCNMNKGSALKGAEHEQMTLYTQT